MEIFYVLFPLVIIFSIYCVTAKVFGFALPMGIFLSTTTIVITMSLVIPFFRLFQIIDLESVIKTEHFFQLNNLLDRIIESIQILHRTRLAWR